MRTVCLPLANVVGNVIAHVPVARVVQCREPALTTAPFRGAPASRAVKTTFCLWCSLQDFFEAFGVSPGMAWVCQTPPVPLLMTTSARVRLPSTARDVVTAPLGLPRSWTTPITSPDGSVRTACSARGAVTTPGPVARTVRALPWRDAGRDIASHRPRPRVGDRGGPGDDHAARSAPRDLCRL